MQQRLQEDARFDLVASTDNGLDAIRLARLHQPNVALLDFKMPKANGLEAMIELHRWAPQTQVAVFTARDDLGTISALVEAGATGVLSKSDPPEDTIEQLRRVAKGDPTLSDSFRATLDSHTDQISLSPRETEVLIRISKGLSNPAIAEDLSLSPKTVESHRASLMRKLNVRTTATLMLAAARQGLIDF